MFDPGSIILFFDIFYDTIWSLIYTYLAYQLSKIYFKLIKSVELLFYLYYFIIEGCSVEETTIDGSSN